jgi:hypothetical protein
MASGRVPGRGPSGPAAEEEAGGPLRMSPAVACRSIEDDEDHEALPDAALTHDAKLLIDYRPLGYSADRVGRSYHIHLTRDWRIRRRGEKEDLDLSGRDPLVA